jgi:hypothetical protein
MATQDVLKFGKSTIILQSDEFAEGHSNGIIAYPQDQPLTDRAIYEIIVKNILDVSHTDTWNAGYIMGALHGLFVGRSEVEERDAPQVQLGHMTLHLNNWRFREGYYDGREDQQASQHERPATIITARDLLRYIAHYNPETKRYYFAEEELSTLEETLGQLIGYLCAGLFLQPEPGVAQERHTEPLRAVLQEAN